MLANEINLIIAIFENDIHKIPDIASGNHCPICVNFRSYGLKN